MGDAYSQNTPLHPVLSFVLSLIDKSQKTTEYPENQFRVIIKCKNNTGKLHVI